MSVSVNLAHQAFLLARLSEFCDHRERVERSQRDPWGYMREKLLQIEPALAALKQELLAATGARLVAELRRGPLDGEACADYKQVFERLLSRSDFVDVAMHLDAGAGPAAAASVQEALSRVSAHHAFLEERLPGDQRDPSWERLVGELRGRLGLDALEKALARKPRTARRKRMVLRRLRRNVTEYCTVVHLPTRATDTITPFMLPRVEALIGSCLRFLNRHR